MNIVDNVNKVVRPDGNARQQALRRLRKSRPDLHKRVLGGELSAHAAMVEAGFRKKATPLSEKEEKRAAGRGSKERVCGVAGKAISPLIRIGRRGMMTA